jgi:tRNA pseudouridine38-40 synthase
MHYYKTIIQYEGTNYAGFQWQNGVQTVQSEFNKAASQLISGKFSTIAASRTDTGVHALEQIVKISSINPIDTLFFLPEFNRILPRDIRCANIEECDGAFKPTTATLKEYRYFFTNLKKNLSDEDKFVANISNELNLDEMMICMNALKGNHDFCNFYSSGSNIKSTRRNVISCALSTVNPHEIFSNEVLFHIPEHLTCCYEFKIQANGFLKQMIRHIISALWQVGSGKLTTDEFVNLLNGPKSAKQSWKVASPNGLFLYRIQYQGNV